MRSQAQKMGFVEADLKMCVRENVSVNFSKEPRIRGIRNNAIIERMFEQSALQEAAILWLEHSGHL